MSRFENLEFDEPKKDPASRLIGTPIRDAAYFERQAEQFYLAGDFERALRHFSRCLEQNSAWFNGWLGQVRMLIELGEYPEAVMWADKALHMFPDNPDLLAAKAVALTRNGQMQKAMAYSDNALSRPNGTAYVWIARAEVLADQRHPAAEVCARNAAAMGGPRLGVVQLQAGRLLLRAGRFVAALDHLQQAAMLLPSSSLAWLELARCQEALGYPQAATSIEQCLHLRPGWSEAYALRGRIENQGVFARLRAFFRRK